MHQTFRLVALAYQAFRHATELVCPMIKSLLLSNLMYSDFYSLLQRIYSPSPSFRPIDNAHLFERGISNTRLCHRKYG
jgi:hypothetical protein